MSTEYYVKSNACPTCGHHGDQIIIGNSSMGWKFCFNENIAKNLKTKQEWMVFLQDKQIEDEYSREISLEDFAAMIEAKQKGCWLKTAHDPDTYHGDKYEYLDSDGYRFCRDRKIEEVGK